MKISNKEFEELKTSLPEVKDHDFSISDLDCNVDEIINFIWKNPEFPGPIQKLVQRRSLWISIQSLGFILIGMEVSPWRQIPDTRAFRIDPGNVRSRIKEITTLHHE